MKASHPKYGYFFSLLATLILMLLHGAQAFGQGQLNGKVTDSFGEPLPFVNVFIAPSQDPSDVTDFEGDYSFSLPTGTSTIEFSFVGFQTERIDVEIKEDETKELNVTLTEGEGVRIAEATVDGGKQDQGTDAYLENLIKKSGSTISVIGNREMGLRGDSKADDAVKRVSGVSSVGGIISVRGLNDRYIKTLLNGMELPTLDPFRNNVRLDMIPTGLIDNIIITKTETPDLVGDWAGAYMSIQTKDYPSDLLIRVSSSVGYNTNATFNEIVSSEASSTDWLGYDNGFRDIPNGASTNQEEFPRGVSSPSLSQQFDFLNLYTDLAQYGIDDNTPLSQGNIFHQIGLFELGYLGPGDFNNPNAVENAINAYEQDYPSSYFLQPLNAELASIGQSFENTWIPIRKTAPLNTSQSFTIGNTTSLFKREFGFIAGMRYSRSFSYDPDSEINTTTRPASTGPNVILANDNEFVQQISNERNGINFLANVSYKLNDNNRISFLFMPNLSGKNEVREYTGQRGTSDGAKFGYTQVYTERKQLLYQLETSHFLPKSKIRINLKGGLTNGTRNILDFREIIFEKRTDNPNTITELTWEIPSTERPNRRFIFMDENVAEAHIDVEIPILKERAKATKLKVGASYLENDRTTSQGLYVVDNAGQVINPLFVDDELSSLQTALNTDLFAQNEDGSLNLSYTSQGTEIGEDVGFRTISSAYVMGDYVYGKARVVGGVRVEHTDIISDIKSFYESDFPVDDPRRITPVGLINPGIVNELNVLPSLNIVYGLSDKAEKTINLRLNYSKSIARPSLRELVGADRPSFELRNRVRGNAELEMTRVDNFDFKVESYLKNGVSASVGLFYKDFVNHIELVQNSGFFTWQNVDESVVYGIELEAGAKLFRALDTKVNLTLVESSTTVNLPEIAGGGEITRDMFGQAPYVLNVGLVYKLDSLGMTCSASYNVQGAKLAAVRIGIAAAPDIFELPRHMVDLKVSKKLGEHFSASVGVRDLLNSPLRRAYKFDRGFLLDFDNLTLGTTYNLGITYNL